MTNSTTATIHKLSVKSRLICSDCGAPGEGTCGCGAPYLAAGQRAAEAVVANPEKSDRAIAKEIGVGNKTVSRARKAVVSHDTPAKRTGTDGKSYPARVQRKPRRTPAECAVARFENAISFLHNTFENADDMSIPNTIPAEVGEDAIKQLKAVKVFLNKLIERIKAAALKVELTPTDEVTP